MKPNFLILFLLTTTIGWSQQTITLDACYNLVNENYPLAKQTGMLSAKQESEMAAINTEKLPQFNLSAQATYQSDVIEIPLENSSIEPLNKDQYRTTLSVNQLIYGGGLISAKSNLTRAKYDADIKQVEVNLYQLKMEVNQLYFSILLTQEKYQLLLSKQAQLKIKLKEVISGIENGVLLPTSNKTIEVELLKIDQDIKATLKDKATLISSLSSLIGFELNDQTKFETPLISTNISSTLNRPELELFQLKREEIDASELLLSKENLPKLSGFVDGGYGNPGLNILDNSFQGFYTVGLKLKWNVFDWKANKKQRKSLLINKDIIDNDSDVFELNTNIKLNEYEADINKLTAMLASDTEIIDLRREVLSATESQLQNGIITTSVYITELTNLYEDERRLVTHRIQLELVKSNYNIIQGN
ncbi:TolC family protein [Gelidibacter japonicus]|uniref:TolC family protein n=1 Tax=Gelidibacter japonicus TaxID=1962232 RepID=UPI002020FCCC|nr:TolC family protein [Gelidibacter japonicus]MCL8007269.1 TolC family protein [Gelidibacter japonicus]